MAIILLLGSEMKLNTKTFQWHAKMPSIFDEHRSIMQVPLENIIVAYITLIHYRARRMSIRKL